MFTQQVNCPTAVPGDNQSWKWSLLEETRTCPVELKTDEKEVLSTDHALWVPCKKMLGLRALQKVSWKQAEARENQILKAISSICTLSFN